MTIEEFVMVVDDRFADLEVGCHPLIINRATKQYAKTFSDYRWAIRELESWVYDDVGDGAELYKFIDSVVAFEYQMDLFAKVNDRKRQMFENARNVAMEVEEILNAML